MTTTVRKHSIQQTFQRQHKAAILCNYRMTKYSNQQQTVTFPLVSSEQFSLTYYEVMT